MSKGAVVRARIDETLKHDVEAILEHLGLTVTDAINVLFRQIRHRNGLPFKLEIPTEITREAMEDVNKKQHLTKFKSWKEAKAHLEK